MKSASMLFVLLFAACGDDGAAMIDAPVIIDSPPPIDALTCAAPTKLCGSTCLAVNTDEENCGDCGVECKGGEACDATCACAPAAFIPAMIGEPDVVGAFDQFQGGGGLTLAIAPTFGQGGINPIIVAYDEAAVPLDTDIDLSMVALGDAPFIAAAYRIDLASMSGDAAFIATAGTLRLTRACGSQADGTLTNATFRGINGGFTNPMIDPAGCTITIPSMTFHIMTAACP